MLERLTRLRDFDSSQNLEPRKLVELGLCDAVKIFVKGEPHKLAKLQEGRVRLIYSVSVVDNIIARMLFSLQNSAEINEWAHIPLKPGMGLNDPGMVELVRSVVEGASTGNIGEADVAGWDFSIFEKELSNSLEGRLELNHGSGTVWERIALSHYYCIARKVFVLSDGSMYQQLEPGIMPSGWYCTSRDNSYMRAVDATLVVLIDNELRRKKTIPFVITMGDDSVERFIEGAKQYYLKMGKTVKMYNGVIPSKFEFCSNLFLNGVGRPVNPDKQLINLLSYVPKSIYEAQERHDQFCYEMRNHPELENFNKLIFESGWGSHLLGAQ